MDRGTAYLWMFPREDFPCWRALEPENRAIETYDDYLSELAAKQLKLEAAGKLVVRIRMDCKSMRAALAMRRLPSAPATRGFVLQAEGHAPPSAD